jgi:hypothetical protein
MNDVRDTEGILPAEKKLIEAIFGEREAVGVPELARRVGFHPESLRRAAREGRLGAVKAGGHWLVVRGGLAAYLQRSRERRGGGCRWGQGRSGATAREEPEPAAYLDELSPLAYDGDADGGDGIPF